MQSTEWDTSSHSAFINLIYAVVNLGNFKRTKHIKLSLWGIFGVFFVKAKIIHMKML